MSARKRASGPLRAEPTVVTSEIAAEAAVWVARLHGPDRSNQMERECLAWQSRSAQHRLAFERCTEVWQEVPGLKLGDAFAPTTKRSSSGGTHIETSGGRRLALALGMAGAAALGATVLLRGTRATRYDTKIGEQRLVILEDGTRLTLNTATRVSVALDANSRSVSIERGEALLDVAKDPLRPFLVRAGGCEVTALGTVFSVRLIAQQAGGTDLAITLIEGKVSVLFEALSTIGSPPSQLVLQPGERVQYMAAPELQHTATSLRVDRPSIDQVVAWTRGQALFDDVSLDHAVAEMNRYSRTPIVLVGFGAAASMGRVSGAFRTGDNVGFAHAVATLHGLVARELPDRVELSPKS